MLVRKWVNQPSVYQPYHHLHGSKVLYDSSNQVIYHLDGPIISQPIDPLVLSDGWPIDRSKHNQGEVR